jgi:hypothetical protein
MEALRYTLLTDGSSDTALMPLIDWLLLQHRPDLLIQPQFARGLGPVGHALNSRLPAALLRYPCDLLFVHRDAEGASAELRLIFPGCAVCRRLIFLNLNLLKSSRIYSYALD